MNVLVLSTTTNTILFYFFLLIIIIIIIIITASQVVVAGDGKPQVKARRRFRPTLPRFADGIKVGGGGNY